MSGSLKNADYDDSFVADVLPAFISEAQDHIEMIERLLLKLEAEPDNRELLDALFRSAHTIKGSAGIFGLEPVVAFTHHVETLLDQLRNDCRFSAEIGTLLLQCNDQIRILVNAASDRQDDTQEVLREREALVNRLRAAYGDNGDHSKDVVSIALSVDGTQRRLQITVDFGVDTFRNGMDPLAILNYVRGLGTISNTSCTAEAIPDFRTIDPETCHLSFVFELDTEASDQDVEAAFSFVREDCVLRIVPLALTSSVALSVAGKHDASEENDQAPLKPQANVGKSGQRVASNKTGNTDDSSFIRVPAERLDQVINLLGELVIAAAGASLLARQSGNNLLIEANRQINSLVEEMRNDTLKLRMVPIGDTFTRFRRVVRDTAAELGKDIALEITGGDTELDKSMVERIADPLMHLVRNALDHGLETPEQRTQAGKSAQGRLTMSACHESGSILISIIDDGRGIARDKVLARAWDQGLVERDVTPCDADILKLIFEPGFSTAEKVTNLSGRGVGMDVVRRNIEALRGSINVSSEVGVGSRIEIRLPLTLAIIDGFLVSVGASKFVLPLDGVIEVIENVPAVMAQDVRGRSAIELRGRMLPVVNLRTFYELDSPQPERSSVVVVQGGGYRYGLIVDQLHGQHQTVIKPLGKMLRSLRGVSGSTILGNGEVALIYDVNALSELAAASPTATLNLSPTTTINLSPMATRNF